MNPSHVRTAEDVEAAVLRYGNMLFRLCAIMLGNTADAEDAVQEIILKYMQKAPVFESAEHEKAWLIVTAKNKCRDLIRFRARHPQLPLDPSKEPFFDVPDSGILEALLSLPEKFRIVLILHYVEEYSTEEIARLIQRTPSAVKMRLKKGRRLLEEIYRKEYL